MKKIIGFICLLLILLVSCGEETNNEIRFDIDNNIELEIDHYHSGENLSSYIKAYKGEEEIIYSNLQITNKDEIKLGRVEFTVSYEDKSESFFITFVDNYSIVNIHTMNSYSSYEIKNGETLESLKVSLDKDGYTADGFYTDSHYRMVFDAKTPIQNDLELYVKYAYKQEENTKEINLITLMLELGGYIEKLVSDTTDYIPAWNLEGFKGRWNYIDGVFLNSIVNLFNETGKIEYKNFFLKYINYYINEDGEFINPSTQDKTGYRSGELDSVCASRVLFDAYELTGDTRYLKAIEKTYKELMSMPTVVGSNNFWHKTSYENQIWLDGMYMYVPYLARYAKEEKRDDLFDIIKAQYEYIRNNMFDENKKLYYHGNDTTRTIFWADKTTGNSESFWLRSNGWFIVSLVDVLEYFPEGTDKKYLNNLLVEALEGILQYQDETTKMFYQLIDKGPTTYFVSKDYLNALKNYKYGNDDAWIGNYLESSGSSMVAYTLLKASREGYIESSYKKVGKEIFEAVYKHSFNGGLDDICITAGLGPDSSPYRDGSIAYYLAEPVGSDDAKGVGPFLMAYIEYAKQQGIIRKYHTIKYVLPNEIKEASYLDGAVLESLPYPYIPNYIFDGFYFDAEYTRPVTRVILDHDITIYLKYEKEPSLYDKLKESGEAIIIDENFDSYKVSDSLPEFNIWGNKGVYYYINDKDKTNGIDLSLNHIDLGNGYAYLYDDSTDGTQLIVDTGGISSGIIRGYMEVELYYAGNQWTFFQMYGERVDGKIGELFGLRFENGYLQYRVNGGEVNLPLNAVYPRDKEYKIYYEFNLSEKLLTVAVDDVLLVKDLNLPEAACFNGIKIVSSDGLVKLLDSYGNIIDYVHRRAKVDNIIITLE